jgi:hypothetical protein
MGIWRSNTEIGLNGLGPRWENGLLPRKGNEVTRDNFVSEIEEIISYGKYY